MWDLQRNGGNVIATTERILSGRGLEVVSADCLVYFACHSFWILLGDMELSLECF